MAVIVAHGMQEMLVDQRDVFYYITLMNENYAQPDLPEAVHGDLLQGCYHFGHWPAQGAPAQNSSPSQVTLLGSGAILTEVIQAAALLAAQGVAVDVFSVTSWSELAREAVACRNLNAGTTAESLPFITRQLQQSVGLIIAATDYVRAVPEAIRAYLPDGRRYTTLGTDGFGRSDTRAALRAFFKVDAASIVAAALQEA
jgi:pyruvate dehydrogenase E1 component